MTGAGNNENRPEIGIEDTIVVCDPSFASRQRR